MGRDAGDHLDIDDPAPWNAWPFADRRGGNAQRVGELLETTGRREHCLFARVFGGHPPAPGFPSYHAIEL